MLVYVTRVKHACPPHVARKRQGTGLTTSLVSRLDLPSLACSEQHTNKQPGRAMGKKENSGVVLRIRPNIWSMTPMGA